MKTLNKEQKELLKWLIEHRWYKLLLDLIDDFEDEVLKQLKNIDISNEKDLQILWKNQAYLKWLEDLLTTIKSQTNMIWKGKDFN